MIILYIIVGLDVGGAESMLKRLIGGCKMRRAPYKPMGVAVSPASLSVCGYGV
jgi:hypothetical protein